LQNVIERSVIVSESDVLSVDSSWLPREPPPPQAAAPTLFRVSQTHQKELIESALAQSKGRVSGLSGAAVRLGIPPSTLESKIRALRINKHRFKAA
jgi:DNA-binding NtrC family response regulator